MERTSPLLPTLTPASPITPRNINNNDIITAPSPPLDLCMKNFTPETHNRTVISRQNSSPNNVKDSNVNLELSQQHQTPPNPPVIHVPSPHNVEVSNPSSEMSMELHLTPVSEASYTTCSEDNNSDAEISIPGNQ